MKKGYWYLIGAALAYAVMGILVKFLAFELPPLTQTFLRLFVSGLFSFAYLVITKTEIKIRSLNDFIWILVMGIFGYGLSIIAYTYAFNYAPVANVLFVLSSYPIMSTFLGVMLIKEKLLKKNYIALIMLFIALICMFNPTDISKYLVGNLLSLFVGFSFAFYIVVSKLLNKRGNSPVMISCLSVWVAVATSGVGFLLFDPLYFHASIPTIIGIIGFGLLNFVAFTLLNIGFKYVNVATGSMLLLVEPIAGSLLGFAFFAEVPSLLFLFGAGVMILSIYISTRTNSSTP